MNKRGFTLIELLVVIVILAIIALITVPNALAMITTARQRSNQRSNDSVLRAAELFCLDGRTASASATAPASVTVAGLAPNYIRAVPSHLGTGTQVINFNATTCAPTPTAALPF